MLMPWGCRSGPNKAIFEPGQEVEVLETNVDSAGATLLVGLMDSPLDGVRVEIPKDALPQRLLVRLQYNTGKFKPVSGIPSGVIASLSAGDLRQFRKVVKIEVHYDAKRFANMVVVGFAIGPTGRVSGFQLLSQDQKAGTAIFATLVPVQFTWIYVPLAF